MLSRFVFAALVLVAAGKKLELSSEAQMSRAQEWLSNHHGKPSASALADLKTSDPNSYALVQNILSSHSVVMSLANAEARSMDTPWRKPVKTSRKFAGLQYAKNAKIQRPRSGLVEQNSFIRTVENAATAAEDASKLQWDFGVAAAGSSPVTALEQEEKTSTNVEKNPILADAEDMRANPEEAGSHARASTEAQLKLDNERKSSYERFLD